MMRRWNAVKMPEDSSVVDLKFVFRSDIGHSEWRVASEA